MANLTLTSDIKSDVLFRGGEKTDGTSEFDAQVMRDINRAQKAVALGGSEFAPDIQESWWWLKKDPPGVLVVEAPYETGTVSVTNSNALILFSSPPAFSAKDWFFRTDNDIFRIVAHTAGEASATLDTIYTGESGPTKDFRLFKLEYALAADVLRLAAPMRGYGDGYFEVDGCELMSLERDYPLGRIEKGRPDRFAMVTETKVRFNRMGIDTGGKLIRLEYDYLRQPPDLNGTNGEEPIVPKQFRYILADMALFWLLLNKDDNRDAKLAEIVTRGLSAMAMENRHRMTIYSRNFGRISPRGRTYPDRKPLRTESGFIVG